MKIQDFEHLKTITDIYDYQLIGSIYYSCGTNGISKLNKKFEKIGHCNDFRNKSFKEVKHQLNQEIV